ncbi:hypothetical protein LMG23992_05100 [Cupriavidus laharis]|uniref:HEPN domain-containing protein n=1 Tax=Cupriavidus laharis TaxID=151654 RepID=A0ABM8XU51_9BURK|nr:hypothetical protein [Cupriavidus laharis]CAG9183892.1 hypothetical protein LMG23992_05100 [Cupriavidus laharis]
MSLTPSPALQNLERVKKLKAEPPDSRECAALLRSAEIRLGDAQNVSLSIESQFDLVYNAAHAAALAALRRHGYRSDNRYLVFQCLQHTLHWSAEQWRLLDVAHHKRNLAEYEGDLTIDQAFVKELIAAVRQLVDAVRALLAE